MATLLAQELFAQYPPYFSYDAENGLPGNEIYSILQDERGFIWVAGDAGLHKFDGIRHIPYKCNTRKSKSITGLTLSSSGKIYCYNFRSQIFYLDDDSLKELKHTYDTDGNEIHRLDQRWDEADWVDNSKTDYTYDTINNQLTSRTSIWDNNSGSWLPVSNGNDYFYTCKETLPETGIATHYAETLRAYPNPVKDVLHVETEKPDTCTLRNLLGNTLYTFKTDGRQEINISHLPPGLYILNSTSGKLVKIMKE